MLALHSYHHKHRAPATWLSNGWRYTQTLTPSELVAVVRRGVSGAAAIEHRRQCRCVLSANKVRLVASEQRKSKLRVCVCVCEHCVSRKSLNFLMTYHYGIIYYFSRVYIFVWWCCSSSLFSRCAFCLLVPNTFAVKWQFFMRSFGVCTWTVGG